jgi:hypothetical protein
MFTTAFQDTSLLYNLKPPLPLVIFIIRIYNW